MGSYEHLIPYNTRNYAILKETHDMLLNETISPDMYLDTFQVPVPSLAWKFKSSSGQREAPNSQ